MSTTVDSRNIGHTLTPPTEAAVANNAAAKTLRIEEAELVLLKLKLYTALVVWRSMLREAKRNQSWRICHAVTAIRKETCFSKPRKIWSASATPPSSRVGAAAANRSPSD